MKRQLIGLAATALLATSALAATDGTLGSTSTGTLTVTATVPQPQNPTGARISGFTDIDFGNYSPNEASYRFGSFCLYHSGPTATVSLKQPLLPDSTEFRLIGPSGNQDNNSTLAMTIIIGASRLTSSGESISGVFNRTSENCAVGGRTDYEVQLFGGGAGRAAGAYSAVFQITIRNE